MMSCDGGATGEQCRCHLTRQELAAGGRLTVGLDANDNCLLCHHAFGYHPAAPLAGAAAALAAQFTCQVYLEDIEGADDARHVCGQEKFRHQHRPLEPATDIASAIESPMRRMEEGQRRLEERLTARIAEESRVRQRLIDLWRDQVCRRGTSIAVFGDPRPSCVHCHREAEKGCHIAPHTCFDLASTTIAPETVYANLTLLESWRDTTIYQRGFVFRGTMNLLPLCHEHHVAFDAHKLLLVYTPPGSFQLMWRTGSGAEDWGKKSLPPAHQPGGKWSLSRRAAHFRLRLASDVLNGLPREVTDAMDTMVTASGRGWATASEEGGTPRGSD